MTFHCIGRERNRRTLQLFAAACRARNIQLKIHNPDTFSHLRTAPGRPGDLLYSFSPRDAVTRVIERHLAGPGVQTFFTNPSDLLNFTTDALVAIHRFAQAGLPMPATIPLINQTRTHLRACLKAVGGLPVVLKIPGFSRGQGVMKVSNPAEYLSLASYALRQQAPILLKQYIDTPSSARLVVVGDTVAASVEFTASADDFRSHVGSKMVRAHQYDVAVEQVAIRAVQALGLEFGGVDLLLNADGAPYIAEVNFPCRFVRTQQVSGRDIAGAMIDHLRQKATAPNAAAPTFAYAPGYDQLGIR